MVACLAVPWAVCVVVHRVVGAAIHRAICAVRAAACLANCAEAHQLIGWVEDQVVGEAADGAVCNSSSSGLSVRWTVRWTVRRTGS